MTEDTKPPSGAIPNPGNDTSPAAPDKVRARRRVPMSIPQQKLQVADIPGYHLHWFHDRNIQRALAAGYEFCDDREVVLNQKNVGNDNLISGNASLGTRVQVPAGESTNEHLTLMKLPLEFWREDQTALQEKNVAKLAGIFRGEQIMNSGPSGSPSMNDDDKALQYVDRKRTSIKGPLFLRPTRKSVT